MSDHLLLITLGPVQDFIAAARRTRDLWYGSHILSELGRTAARALVAGGAQLVFPALPAGDPELEPCLGPLRQTRRPPLNVANKLLAEVPGGIDPEDLARATRDAVTGFWSRDLAARVRSSCADLLDDGIDAAWDEQIDTFVEFVAAWQPLGAYDEARRRIERAIAGRKNLRDFGAWRHLRGGVPKSSLDGARETVLLPSRRRTAPAAADLVRRYRIAEGEELDAVGLVKRAGGRPEQALPIPNVALASWIAFTERHLPVQLAALCASCRDIGVAPVQRPDPPSAQAFPFDAEVLLRSRWRAVFKEQGLAGDPLEWGRRHVAPLLAALSEPYPYVACLVADGDRMGAVIERMASAAAHRGFSASLSDFPSEARRIVEHEHLGLLVYAGGDDVLAFLPLPEALSCADDLRRSFAHVMDRACSGMPDADRPTLSVGVGIGHAMESMGDLLGLGRDAEHLAKEGSGADARNALAVVMDKRSGGQRAWRARWSADPVARLNADAELLKGPLSLRKVYEVQRVLAGLPQPAPGADPLWARVLASEVRRSLARSELGERGEPLRPEALGLALDEPRGYGAVHAEVAAAVARVLVAHDFAAAEPALRTRARGATG